MLGGQPLPRRFLGCIIGHAKAFPVYLEEEGWCQLLHLTFCRLCLTDYSAPPLMPSRGLSQGIPSSHWSNDDITPLPAKAPPPMHEPTNQGCSQMPFCTRTMHSGGLLHPSFLFQLLKGNNSSLLSSYTPNTLYTMVHTSQVSKCGASRVLLHPLYSSCHQMHAFVLLNLSFGLIPDGRLDIRKCPCGHTKSTFHTIFGFAEYGWSLLGGTYASPRFK